MSSKKTTITIVLSILVAFSVFVGILYWQSSHIIENVVEKKLSSVEKQRNVSIDVKKIKLNGLDKMTIGSVKIQQPGDTFFLSMDNIKCQLGLWGLFRGEVVLKQLNIDDIKLNLVEDSARHRNFSFLYVANKPDVVEDNENPEKKSVFEKISDLLTRFFDLVPEDLNIGETKIVVKKNDFFALLNMSDFKIEDNHFNSPATLSTNGRTQKVNVKGTFKNRDRSIECQLSSANPLTPLHFPFFDYKYNADIRSDTLCFSFKTLEESHDHMKLAGKLSMADLRIKHARLSDRDLNFGDGALNYVLNIRNNSIELDSSSTAIFNHLNFHPYVELILRPSLILTMSVNKETFPSSELFNSIPNGLFLTLDSLQTTGDLDFHFYFHADTSHIDDLVFESDLNKHPNFKIVSFGKKDFREINAPFLYDAYDKDNLVREFEIGPENPNFRYLNQISPYLQWAVLLSEDGHFYTHHGFYEGAIRYSLVQDFKERRFARGGSTISMQLVKNVFLNKNKNLMRKLEEIMIVWLIENEHLVSKQRMFEIYLNIIEWGPKVYGAEEASRFYFNKHASQINPSEAIFLATIIPSPKKFMYKFDSNHELKPYMNYYYKLVGRKMLSLGKISYEEYESLSRLNVQITGRASAWLPKMKVAEPKDSVQIENEGESLIDLDE